MTLQLPPMSHPVQQAFAACTGSCQIGMHHLRRLIFTTAAIHPQIGHVVEDLRWGQPAYLTPDTRAACSLRIGPHPDGGFGLFVHCKTDLIAAFLQGPGAGHRTEGTRAVLFRTAEEITDHPLTMLITGALTYHQRKTAAPRPG
jgi:hypothetical protein